MRFHALASALLLLAGLVSAQAPKLGDPYEDEVDLGFSVRCPKDWNYIPASPGELNLIGKYAPPNTTSVLLGKGAALMLNVWLVKFDRRGAPGDVTTQREVGGVAVRAVARGRRDIHEWMQRGIDEGTGWRFDEKRFPKELKGVKDVPSSYWLYDGTSTTIEGWAGGSGATADIRCYVAVYGLSDDVEIALVGIGPGDSRKWRAYEKAFEQMAKSFKKLEVATLAGAGAGGPTSPRDVKRAKLELEAAKSQDWKLYETPNYFVISNNDDQAFLDELMERLEAIRAVYERDYPYEKARKVLETIEEEDPGDETEEDGELENRSLAAVDPMAASRTSVVRVCATRDQYHQYGGPTGSAGYWNSAEEELVIFDAKMTATRDDTWLVLNHEAFHQYIFYFYGNIAPHSWYNEGTGDFYSGYEYRHRRFELHESAWRRDTARELIRTGRYPSPDEFVRWTKSEYYGNNDLGLGGGECYALGWSFIYFLRTGHGGAKGWQPAWGSILDTYLATLATTGDLDRAVDTAFAGVDWGALEASWIDYGT